MALSLNTHMAPYEVPVMKNDGPFFRPSILGHEVVGRNFKRRLFHDYSTDAVERMEMILLTVAGHAQVQFAGARQRLRRGSLLFLGLPCDARILLHEKGCPWAFYYVHVTDPKPAEAFRWLRNQHGNVVHLPTGRSVVPRLAEQSANLITTLRRVSNHNVYSCSQHTYDWFLQVANACQQEQSRAGSLRGVKSVEVSEVAEGCHTIKEYARQLRYSPSYLSRKLAKTWQKSPGEALRTARLEKAASLLKSTDLAVWEVGSRVGYFSTSSFIRAFHGLFGTTPAMFRHNPVDLRPTVNSATKSRRKVPTTISKAKGARRGRV
jgi:AraC-like DNA-binding protein